MVYTVPTRGIGKPDYSKEVSSAKERAGLTLGYGQTLKLFGCVLDVLPSPFAWVLPQLAIGASASVVDYETGLSTPYVIPKGYTIALIAGGYSADQDARVRFFIDGFLVVTGVSGSGIQGYENKIISITTATIDPTGATAHTLDIQITNLGGAILSGSIDWTGLLQKVGSPPLPPDKKVRCKWCGHEHTVPNKTTYITCPECKKLFIVADYSQKKSTT